MTQDTAALLWSFLYVGGVVALGETTARLGLSRDLARKIIHVGVGFWIFGTFALFTTPYLAIIPPLASAAGNFVIHRHRLLKAVEAAPDNLGTVWYPISFALLILTCWERPEAAIGGVMAMTIGDALASTVGIRLGRHTYRSPGGAGKSLEGSLAMFAGTLAVLLLILPADLGWPLRLAVAGLGAIVGMSAEGLGEKGRDNLWVPLSVGAVLWWALNPATPAATLIAVGAGAVLAAIIGIATGLKGSLSTSGVLGAIITGTLLFGFGGWTGGLALIGFFISSSLLSRLFRDRKQIAEAEYAKTGTRDLGQTLANGGVAAAAALLYGLTGEPAWMGAILGALAAANADTWATELGVLSRTPPRLMTTLRQAEPGTSGAVSLVGTLAAAGGAAFVGLIGALTDASLWPAVAWLILAGLAGAYADSLAGATIQGVYWCPGCQKETERAVHRCGRQTVLRRGLGWLGNDTVNLMATLTGAIIGYLALR